MIRQLLEIKRDKLDLRLGGYALVALLLVAGLEALVSLGALQAGVAAVAVVITGGTGKPRTRMARMGIVTLIGGIFGFLSYISAETGWQAALVLGVVTYLTGLAYGLGPSAGRVGYLLLLWSLAVLIGQAHGGDPSATAVAFVVGGGIALLVIGVAAVAGLGKTHPPSEDSTDATRPSLRALARSDLGLWSFVRAVLTVVAVVIGYWLTSDLDPYWPAIALLIVFQPDLDKTLFKAAQRGLGTLIGATSTAALLGVVDSEPPIVAILLIATFGAIVFYHANYMIYAFFLTNAVLLYYWLAVDHEVSGPSVRLIATIIGIALALAGMALLGLHARKTAQDATPDPE